MLNKSQIECAHYYTMKKTPVTVCVLTLKNGQTAIGQSVHQGNGETSDFLSRVLAFRDACSDCQPQ